ncbi:MAG: S-adenosylmethionine:tRNA ribosyltransferase-isomerase [Hyphomicrobiaceae bacterium]|jgi:S-adenosylmethionine:tRNA ribosyltransferase-isomerase
MSECAQVSEQAGEGAACWTGPLTYELPEELIAQHPAARREDSRLMVVDRARDTIEHHTFRDLPEYLPEHALLVANDSAVFPARLFARRPTGGKVELLILGLGAEPVAAMFRSGKGLRDGERLRLVRSDGEDLEGEDLEAAVEVVGEPVGGRCQVRAAGGPSVTIADLVERHGEVPLPPYIRGGMGASLEDRRRYQTVYAQPAGSVAAPTAGLHFSHEVLASIAQRGHEFETITLHVGPGTFTPIRGSIATHHMAAEHYRVGASTAAAVGRAQAEGRTVLAVGTTTVRALEAAAAATGVVDSHEADTSIFIKPGHEFRAVGALLTNFHLPGSTLLALIQAFAGEERVRQAYNEAVARRYRFYSYGDAMLIL